MQLLCYCLIYADDTNPNIVMLTWMDAHMHVLCCAPWVQGYQIQQMGKTPSFSKEGNILDSNQNLEIKIVKKIYSVVWPNRNLKYFLYVWSLL